MWSSELNSSDLVLAEDQRVPAIVEQNTRMTLRSAAVLDAELAKHDYLVEDRFTVTDIVVGYTVNWIEADGHLGEFGNLRAYLDRLCEREHCTLRRRRGQAMPDPQNGLSWEKGQGAPSVVGQTAMAYYANGLSHRSFLMPTRNVVLSDHQAAFVAGLVASGRYQNASEVMREGLRLVEREETEAEIRLKAMREAADAGVADVAAGRYRAFDAAEALRENLSALTNEALSGRSSDVDRT